MDAFFEQLDDTTFAASEHTRGPWDPGLQHAGPPCALLGRAIERCDARPDFQVARFTAEILRPVPIAPLTVAACVSRGGRSVELLDASLSAGGMEVVRARAWRVRTSDIGVAVPAPASPVTSPADSWPLERLGFWSAGVGYHTAMEWRFAEGSFADCGPATVWLRMRVPLVAGEDPSPLARVLTAADSGNGVSAVLDLREHYFINTDLTVALHRLPETQWVCLQAASVVEANGIGQSHSRLHGENGPLGHAVQTLFVAAR